MTDDRDPPAAPRHRFCGCCSAPPRTAASTGGDGKHLLATAPDADKLELPLVDYAPRSVLRVPTTRIERPRFPVIDVHTHLSWMRDVRGAVPVGEAMTFFTDPAALLPLMERKGIRAMVNLTGGVGRGLEDTIARFDRAAPWRFLTMTEP